MNLQIIVPAFNESSVIYEVLNSLPKRIKGVDSIQTVVVDDGSSDNTLQEAEKARVKVVRHLLNRGVGAATKTGFEWAKKTKADIIVTFDADGQHDPRDIAAVVRPIVNRKADVVIGSRFKKKQRIPLDRFLLNSLANLTTFIVFGVFSSDSQSGLRAFSRKAVETINIELDRMEFSSEILLEAKRFHLRTIEVPIHAIYSTYSRGKGQKNLNAIPIFAKFVVKILK